MPKSKVQQVRRMSNPCRPDDLKFFTSYGRKDRDM